MGIITVEKSDHLYWLGRYTERVFTTLRTFCEYYDRMIDGEVSYTMFCEKLCIPDVYGSKKAFYEKYLYDENDPFSVYKSLIRAYDNAVVMRSELGSETLAYIQMALNLFIESKTSEIPLIKTQDVIDCVLAFWGSVDEQVSDPDMRHLLKAGKYIERLDLFIRMEYSPTEIAKVLYLLTNILERSPGIYNRDMLKQLHEILETMDEKQGVMWHAVSTVGQIYEVGAQ
ncbi:MAG: alpha-E domain-containing protein [Clostridiaceae bacterium]